MTKKIWILLALVVVLTVGFSLFIMEISGYNKNYSAEAVQSEKVVPTQVKTMIMKCGAGKCGAAMMEEVQQQEPDKKVIMKCGSGKCGAAMNQESK